jgi:hypothetical protein
MRLVRIGLAGLALSMVLSACNETKQMEAVLADYGFTRNIPPSTLYGPGTVVYRENYDPRDTAPKTAQLGYLCDRQYPNTAYPIEPVRSDTESRDIASKLGGRFSIGAPALKSLLDIDLGLSASDTVNVAIRDVSIAAYSIEALDAIQATLGERCRKIVNRNIRKRNAYQVVKVLQASVDFEINLDASANAAAKAEVVRKKLASIDASVEYGDKTVVKGKSLYYGVKLEPIETEL